MRKMALSSLASPPVPRDHAPFWLGTGEIGCLLVHGFTGSPAEMRPLGQKLAHLGYTVHAVQLAGHDGTSDLVGTVDASAWIADVERGLCEVRQHCAHVFVIGFSMGGALALHLAARHPEIVALVALSPAIRLPRWWHEAALPIAHRIVPEFYPLARADFSDPGVRQEVLRRSPPGPPPDLDDPAVVAYIRHAARFSLKGVYNVQQVGQSTRRVLAHVRQPLLVMHGTADDVAVPACARQVMARVSSADKRLIWLPGAHHLIVNERQEDVHSAVESFLGRYHWQFPHVSFPVVSLYLPTREMSVP